jgi:hypothetical protein
MTMARKPTAAEPKRVKQTHRNRPDWSYFLLEPDRSIVSELEKAPVFDAACVPACTRTITLLPKSRVDGQTGIGYQMINVNGYRVINAYVISDPLSSTTQRGFSLELSFSLNPFVLGVGVVGETSFFFDFESYFESGTLSHRLARAATSDLTTIGGLPWIGGVDLTHILRLPVMGSFVRASVFNEDTTARNVEVSAYLST